jgi:hypothetical protein
LGLVSCPTTKLPHDSRKLINLQFDPFFIFAL